MRLIVSIALALLALPAAASAAPRASVLLTECERSAEASERSAGFEGRMRGRAAQQLEMRFTLQVRKHGQRRYKRVAVPGWSEWHEADTGVTRYSYEKRLENLEAPARYRALVRFRWRNAAGRVVRRARAVSKVCKQPDLRANLRPLGLRAIPGGYAVPVRNGGATAAGPFSVLLTVNGVQQKLASLDGLGARSRREIRVDSERCEPGSEIVVTVDSELQVDERNERDNVLRVPCPPPGR